MTAFLLRLCLHYKAARVGSVKSHQGKVMCVVSELSNLASWAAAGVALLAVIVGPLVSRWQINQTARTNEAVNRIQVMTDDLAAFVALSSSLATNPNLYKANVNEWKEKIDRLSFYKARIALRLNPSREADAAINDTANKLPESVKPAPTLSLSPPASTF
ncbi:MAG: hypothetical protein GBQ79_14490 [Halomonas sp.]|nr:hypothetical protein [Halomonas sp.]